MDADAEGSPRRNASFGSRIGIFVGSGLSSAGREQGIGRRVEIEHTRLVGVLLPETFPLAEIERHSTFCIHDHGKGCVVRDGVEKFGTGISTRVGRDVEQFGWTWRGWERIGVPDTDQQLELAVVLTVSGGQRCGGWVGHDLFFRLMNVQTNEVGLS